MEEKTRDFEMKAQDVKALDMKAQDFEIDRMTREDLTQVLQIEKQCFSDPWSEDGFVAALDAAYSILLCARRQEEVAGYCCLYHILDEGEVMNVAVAPKFRSRGIGFWMFACLIEEGIQAGVRRFLLDVRVTNDHAIALYEKAGFRTIAREKNFYERPVEDGWLMEYCLEQN